MISYEQAVDVILAQAVPLNPARVALGDCLGLALAGPVAADIDLPPADQPDADTVAVHAGEIVLAPGSRMTPARIAAAAAVGAERPWVYPAPRVGLLGVGDALVDFTVTPAAGQMRHSAAPALAAAMARAGCTVTDAGLCRDVPSELSGRLTRLLVECDMIVLVGGDAGEAVRGLGGTVRIDGVAMRPAGDVLLATVDEQAEGGNVRATDPVPGRPKRRYVLALESNPAGALAGWLMLGTILAGRLMGRAAVEPPRVLAMTDAEVPAADDAGRVMQLVPARLRPDDKFAGWRIEPVSSASDAPVDIFALGRANGLIVRPPGAGRLARRAACEVVPLDPMLSGLM